MDGNWYYNFIGTDMFKFVTFDGCPEGRCGLKDSSGSKGRCGPEGCSGSKGRCGPEGCSGSKGRCGSKGCCGPEGCSGSKGRCDPEGCSGSKGRCGPEGCFGSKGRCGSKGLVFGCSCELLRSPVELKSLLSYSKIRLSSLITKGVLDPFPL